ncbi:MAG: diguanylate cyclase [Clostridiaceae bacterium]|nr:diguanylate cyclase [Clostridiaceae bacterium]
MGEHQMDIFINKKAISRELLIEVNNYGIITEITSNCFDILGYTNSEMLNTNIFEYLNYTFDDLVLNENFNAEISKKDGVKLFFDICATPLVTNNIIEGICFSFIDISKYKEFEDREKMFFKMFEDAKDIVCRLELIPELKFTYISPSVEDIVGYTVEEHMKNPMLPFEIVHPDDREIQFSKIKGDIDSSKFFQVRMKHKNGYYVWVEDYIIPQYNADKQLVAIESITRNIQERKKLEQRLKKLGYHDNLTGLFNKNYFLKEVDLLNNIINISVGIFVCDLDNLKYINDCLGHSMGDNVIKNTGKVLQSVFNSAHIISRTGGDEFVVIVKNKSYLEVERLYNELQRAINQFNENNSHMPIEISIGLAYTQTSLNAIESTLDIADSNMYRNKKQRKQILKKFKRPKPIGI